MSVATLSSPVAQAAAPVPAAEPFRWIGGPVFDCVFFIFPTVFAFLYVHLSYTYAGNSTVSAALNASLLTFGLAHAMGTVFFYFDRKNLKRFAKSWGKYFLGPVLIILLAFVMFWGEEYLVANHGMPRMFVLAAVVFVWVNYHLTRQNVGFVSFYRHKWGIYDVREKKIDNQLIYSTAVFLYAFGWFFSGEPGRQDVFFWNIKQHWMVWVLGTLFLWFAVSLAVAGMARWRTLRKTGFRSWPHIAMIATSMTFPLPLAFAMWMPKPAFLVFGFANFGLFAHYMQYIALLFLINKHKYPGKVAHELEQEHAAEEAGLVLFGRLPISGAWLMLIFIFVFGGLFYGFFLLIPQLVAEDNARLASLVAGSLLLGFAMVHYYLDGLIWAFKSEENRKNILPFVKPLHSTR